MKKKRNQRGSVRNKILEALEAYGPMTRAEIERECGLKHKSASSSIDKMMQPNLHRAKRPKLIYVHSWVRADAISGYDYPRPVYALGDHPDKPKPDKPETRKERNARYWNQRKIKQGAGASIFHFAMSHAKGGLQDVIQQFSTNSELAA
jgi:hypothetical protein